MLVLLSERATRRLALLLGALSAALVLFFVRSEPQTNPASRLATIDALVHDGTFAIDGSVFVSTIDKVRAGDHFYSSKPPVLSALGAAIYFGLHHIGGVSFRGDRGDRAIYLVTAFSMLPFHLLLLWATFVSLRALGVRGLAALLGFSAVAFGYLGVGYATTLNNHVPAAALVAACFYGFLRARATASPRYFVLAGASGALAPTMDLGAVFVVGAIAVALLLHDRARFVRCFLPAALPPLALHFGLTYLVAGTVLPIYLHRELYLYPGSYWLAPKGIDALAEPKHVYLFHMLFGHHGVLAMTPLLLLGLWHLGKIAVAQRKLLVAAQVVGGAFVVQVAFYTLTTSNYGGVCVGFRWLLLMTPLLLLFAARWLSEHQEKLVRVVFVCLLLVGVWHTASALTNPWRSSFWQELL